MRLMSSEEIRCIKVTDSVIITFMSKKPEDNDELERLITEPIDLPTLRTLSKDIELAKSISLTDESDKYSVINLLPSWMKEHYVKMLQDPLIGEAYMQGESVLKKVLIAHCDFSVTSLNTRLRHSFWVEYNTAVETDEKMRERPLFYHGCSKDQYYFVIKDMPRLAWITCPLMKMTNHLSAMLELAIHRFDEIINVPLYDEKGKFDPRNAMILMKAMTILDLKVDGINMLKNTQYVIEKSKNDYLEKILNIKKELGVEGDSSALAPQLIKELQESENRNAKKTRSVAGEV